MDRSKNIKYSSSLIRIIAVFLFLSIFSNCDNGDNIPDDRNDPVVESFIKINVNPATTYQEMIGFGGALTWYCDRVTSSSKKNEITDLIFNDLGTDIIRLKNWYYPINYPADKSADQMEVSWFKQHFDATNELFDIAKTKNPNVKVLFSSWGPPSVLKSNDALNEGTLKKENDVFMYDEFADYWGDILDHISFNPDYISIQNEPSYVNSGWETCMWSSFETSSLPDYITAFDKVYDVIKNRTNPPMMIGPEAANLDGNTFTSYAKNLKGKDHLGMYAYHPYNFTNSSSQTMINADLIDLKSYTDKPNIMTEFSGMSWLKTAQLINSTLKIANASGYIYWELMWDQNSDNAMIQVDNTGNYKLTPFYYLMKHYAKYVNIGYQRVDLTSELSSLDAVSFISPSGNQLVTVIINPESSSEDIKILVTDHTATKISGWQSTEEDNYREMTTLELDKEFSITGNSVTTIVLDI